MTNSNGPRIQSSAKTLMAADLVAAFLHLPALAQPAPAPADGDLPCKEESQMVPTDTVDAHGMTHADGYYPLFDGTFKGWFQSCKTGHSQGIEPGKAKGAIFRVARVDGKPVLYTNERASIIGGVVMTNKKFTNFEITFQAWPDYGNEAGVRNPVHQDPDSRWRGVPPRCPPAGQGLPLTMNSGT